MRLLLLEEGHCFRDQILNNMPDLAQTPESGSAPIKTATEGSSLETMRHMVASGMGVTILPKSAAVSQYAADSLAVRPLESAHANRSVALAWRASFPRHKAIDMLRKAILTSQKKATQAS